MTARTCVLGKATFILNFPQRIYKTRLCTAQITLPIVQATAVLTMLSDSHSALSDSLQPKGCSLPSSLSLEFSDYSGLPFPPPGGLPKPGVKLGSRGGFFTI